jgi:hypothetical protein
MRSLKLWHAVVILAFAALPTLNGIDVCLEHDTWWHLAVGQQVVETQSVPEVDPFSRMSQEQPTPWRAYSWLYEVIVYEVFQHFGFVGILLLRTVLVFFSTSVVLAYLVRRGGLSPLALFAGVLTMSVLMMLAKERPWHFTIAFTTLTLWTVQNLRDGLPVRRALWLLPVFALWANLHIQFVLGWGILGLACLFPKKADRAGMIALTAGCMLATTLNPYHVHLLEVIWDYATQAAPLRLVQELSPPGWQETSTISTALMLLGGACLAVRRRPVDPFELGLLIVAAILAARMRRDIWFAAIVAISTLRTAKPPSRKTILSAVAFVALLMFGVRITELTYYGRHYPYAAMQQNRFPMRAVQVIRRSHLPGPILNEFDWGGYLIWNLPSHPVSVDGRTNLYGSERMNQSFLTWSTEDGWKSDPDFLAANIVLAPQERLLTNVLRERPEEWSILFEDELCVVFSRKR